MRPPKIEVCFTDLFNRRRRTRKVLTHGEDHQRGRECKSNEPGHTHFFVSDRRSERYRSEQQKVETRPVEAFEPNLRPGCPFGEAHRETEQAVVDDRIDQTRYDRGRKTRATQGLEDERGCPSTENEVRDVEDGFVDLATFTQPLCERRERRDCHRRAGIEEKRTRKDPDA